MTAPAGLHVRHNKIEGIGPWLWPQTDFWGWRHPKGEFCELRDLILQRGVADLLAKFETCDIVLNENHRDPRRIYVTNALDKVGALGGVHTRGGLVEQ